jgi:hypothetical protein
VSSLFGTAKSPPLTSTNGCSSLAYTTGVGSMCDHHPSSIIIVLTLELDPSSLCYVRTCPWCGFICSNELDESISMRNVLFAEWTQPPSLSKMGSTLLDLMRPLNQARTKRFGGDALNHWFNICTQERLVDTITLYSYSKHEQFPWWHGTKKPSTTLLKASPKKE